MSETWDPSTGPDEPTQPVADDPVGRAPTRPDRDRCRLRCTLRTTAGPFRSRRSVRVSPRVRPCPLPSHLRPGSTPPARSRRWVPDLPPLRPAPPLPPACGHRHHRHPSRRGARAPRASRPTSAGRPRTPEPRPGRRPRPPGAACPWPWPRWPSWWPWWRASGSATPCGRPPRPHRPRPTPAPAGAGPSATDRAAGPTRSATGRPATGRPVDGSSPFGSGSSGNTSTGAGAPSDISAIAAKVDPALVDINTNLSYQNEQAAGTGMVLTSDGVILTNNHVIDGATSISVTDVGNGKTYSASVVGYDRTGDVAVIKLSGASGLRTITTSPDTAGGRPGRRRRRERRRDRRHPEHRRRLDHRSGPVHHRQRRRRRERREPERPHRGQCRHPAG